MGQYLKIAPYVTFPTFKITKITVPLHKVNSHLPDKCHCIAEEYNQNTDSSVSLPKTEAVFVDCDKTEYDLFIFSLFSRHAVRTKRGENVCNIV
jgi:hypothetical protein